MEIMVLQIAITYVDVENVHGPVNNEAGFKVYSFVESKPVSKTFRFFFKISSAGENLNADVKEFKVRFSCPFALQDRVFQSTKI